MKDQYFGDVNDYLKYGILRQLVSKGESLHVVWMLTPSDGTSDGKFTDYLHDPGAWRGYDPELFDLLRSEVVARDRRAVRGIEEWQGIEAGFTSGIVPDDRVGRRKWSEETIGRVESGGLVFFDPDNGIEVPSRPIGRMGSSKYVYWSELEEAWGRGASLLVYQHFTRESRDQFLSRLGREFRTRLGVNRIWALRTPRVAFFLVPQEAWVPEAWRRSREIQSRWRGRIEVNELLTETSEPVQANV